MKRSLSFIIILLLLLSSGCTYRDRLINEGKEALQKGELDRAEKIFDELMVYSADYHQGYLYRGFISLYRDRHQEAISYFLDALERNEDPGLEYLGLGQAYLALEDYEKAKHYLELARPEKPEEAYPIKDYLLGFIYLEKDNPSEARTALKEASKFYPNRGEVWAALGKLSLENLQTLDAIQAYQMAYIRGIRNYDLYAGLGEAYYQLGNFNQAVSIVEKALEEEHLTIGEKEELRLKLAKYNINKNPSQAIDSLEAILETNPEKPEVLLMLGQLYFQQEEYQKSIDAFDLYLKKNPPLAPVYHLKYRSYMVLEKYHYAEKYLKKSIELKPDNITYYLELLNLYQSQNRLSDSIPVYKQVLNLTPEDDELLEDLTATYFALDRYKEAIKTLDKMIVLNTDDIGMYLLKAQAYYQLNDTDAEMNTYQNILEKDGNNILAIKNLAQIYRDTNQLEKAFSLYQRGRELEPEEGQYDLNLGYISILQKRYVKAREFLTSAIKKNPKDFQAYRFLGDTYYVKDEYNKAARYYKKSIQIKSDYYPAIFPLGKTYFYLDKLKTAKGYFKKYLDGNPGHEGSKFYLTRIAWLQGEKTPDF